MNQEIVYTMKNVSKIYPINKYVLKNIYLSYFYGAKIGVLGLNGAGKSSLLRIIAGIDKDFQGEAFFNKEFKIGFLSQEPILDEEKTVKEVIFESFEVLTTYLKEFNEISQKFTEDVTAEEMETLIEKQGELQEKIEALDGWEIDQKVEYAMEALRCPDSNMKIKHISGGEKRRVALCRLILSNPDILLLDEPTNHLDAESVAWLENYLAKFSGTVLAVTHDRYFLDNVAQWILELDRGEGIPWKGNYSSWLDQKEKRLQQEKKQEEKKIKTLQRELEWIRMTPKAKQIKAKSRISSYENLLKEPSYERIKDMQIYIPPGPRLGNIVIEFKKVTKKFGNKLLFDDLNLNILPGSIIGVIGPNGAGKTTLFKMITGQEKPDNGEIVIGQTVKIAYVDQNRDTLNPENTVWEELSDKEPNIFLGNKEIASRAYVSWFNFSGNDQQKKIKDLSGGERNRVNLAKNLKTGANLILLDEPTNDLDVNTMRALEDALLNFGGSVIIISHDRWFLDRICTHVLAFEGNSEVNFYYGNFSDYQESLKKRFGVDAMQPKRVKYRPIN